MPSRLPRAVHLRRLTTTCAVVAMAAAMSAAGCGHPESAADRHFADLRDAVSRMQADHDKVDQRVGALELAASDEKAARPAPAPAPSVLAAPVRVVQLGGAGEGEGEDPNDPGARPDIRVTGAGGGSPRPRSGKAGRARIEESDSSGGRAEGARSSALDPEAKKAYETALAQVQGKQYDRGLEGLAAFLVRWPDHPYAENATYWRGEAYFAQGEYLRAAEQFEGVLVRFGSGHKAPDALLKLGMCHDRLGSAARAREYWDRLKNEHPRSEAAKRVPAAGREPSSRARAGSGDESGVREDGVSKGPRENR